LDRADLEDSFLKEVFGTLPDKVKPESLGSKPEPASHLAIVTDLAAGSRSLEDIERCGWFLRFTKIRTTNAEKTIIGFIMDLFWAISIMSEYVPKNTRSQMKRCHYKVNNCHELSRYCKIFTHLQYYNENQ